MLVRSFLWTEVAIFSRPILRPRLFQHGLQRWRHVGVASGLIDKLLVDRASLHIVCVVGLDLFHGIEIFVAPQAEADNRIAVLVPEDARLGPWLRSTGCCGARPCGVRGKREARRGHRTGCVRSLPADDRTEDMCKRRAPYRLPAWPFPRIASNDRQHHKNAGDSSASFMAVSILNKPHPVLLSPPAFPFHWAQPLALRGPPGR